MTSYLKSNESRYEPFVLFGSSFPKDRDFAQVHVHTCSSNFLANVNTTNGIGLS